MKKIRLLIPLFIGLKVIPLGDGFLGGEAYLQNGDEEIYLNSETDSRAITVKEAKEILKSRQAEDDN